MKIVVARRTSVDLQPLSRHAQTPLPKFKAGALVRVLAHNDGPSGCVRQIPSPDAARCSSLEDSRRPSGWRHAFARRSVARSAYPNPTSFGLRESDGRPGLIVDRFGEFASCKRHRGHGTAERAIQAARSRFLHCDGVCSNDGFDAGTGGGGMESYPEVVRGISTSMHGVYEDGLEFQAP